MATVVDSARNATSAGERPCLRVSPRVHHDEYCNVAGKAIPTTVVSYQIAINPRGGSSQGMRSFGQDFPCACGCLGAIKICMPKNWLIILIFNIYRGKYLPLKSNQASTGVPEISLSPDTSIMYLPDSSMTTNFQREDVQRTYFLVVHLDLYLINPRGSTGCGK